MANIFKNIISLLYPPKCIFCGKLLNVKSEIDVCSSCFTEIPFLDGEAVILPQTCNEGGCDRIICMCRYNGIVKASLLRYKFFNKSGYYRTFSKLLADRIKKMTDYREFDIIISVPLHKRKENIRGYNQSFLISRAIGKQLGIRDGSELLLRVKNTCSQSLLPKKQRSVNIRGAFCVKRGIELRGKKVLLIDDIMTTGYTLDECSRVLKEAGAKTVTAAIIASGRTWF